MSIVELNGLDKCDNKELLLLMLDILTRSNDNDIDLFINNEKTA